MRTRFAQPLSCIAILFLNAVIIVLGPSVAHAQISFSINDGSEEDPTMPELRAELLSRVEADQQARFKLIEAMKPKTAGGQPGQPGSELITELTKIDEDNTAWLAEVIEQHGWPGKTEVGEDGAHSAWLLVQHADRNREFQKKCLELMKAEPEGEVAGKDIAYLTDRVLCAEDKPQLYGTQLIQQDGKMVPRPIEDEEHVDERRAAVGLQPLAEYIKMVEQVYQGGGDSADKDAADKKDNANKDSAQSDKQPGGQAA